MPSLAFLHVFFGKLITDTSFQRRPTYATVCVIEKSFIIGIAFYHIETNKRTLSDSCLNRL